VNANTLFLRFEGPLQSWGDTSKFVIRRSMDAPTKSGVLGLICCAMGWARRKVVEDPIPDVDLHALAPRLVRRHEKEDQEPRRALLDLLNTLTMGVRIDRPGTRWWDYHTVGAKTGILRADGKGIKRTASTKEIETLITRREYLADASFLVALQGDPALIERVAGALQSPKWTLYLGRKSCPPSLPILAKPRQGEQWTNPATYESIELAFAAVPWNPRLKSDLPPHGDVSSDNVELDALIEWRAQHKDDVAPAEAEVWYDRPVHFDPPVHEPRFVMRKTVQAGRRVFLQSRTPAPPRARTDYDTSTWGKLSAMRRRKDEGLCVFCKSPASTAQHVNYRKAGKDDNLAALADPRLAEERMRHLRSLCRLCHDAVTMIEYGHNMGLDRINPEEPRWRKTIIDKRQEIIDRRSLEIRRRRLKPEEVE